MVCSVLRGLNKDDGGALTTAFCYPIGGNTEGAAQLLTCAQEKNERQWARAAMRAIPVRN